MPELVPRTQLRAATRLDLVSVNGARAIGPALAGLVIAYLGGVPVVFALYAVMRCRVRGRCCSSGAGRRPGSRARRERFVPALRAGGRYVWHEPVVRRILLRAILFVAPAMALWALLPLIASQRLGLGADGYGALFGAFGVGAIVGAAVLRTSQRPPVHQRAADGSRAALRGSLGGDRAGPRLSGGPGRPWCSPGWPGWP